MTWFSWLLTFNFKFEVDFVAWTLLKFETSGGPNVLASSFRNYIHNGLPDMAKGQAAPDGAFDVRKVSISL